VLFDLLIQENLEELLNDCLTCDALLWALYDSGATHTSDDHATI